MGRIEGGAVKGPEKRASVALCEIASNLSRPFFQPWSVEQGNPPVQASVARRGCVPFLRDGYGATCASHLAPTMPAV